MKTQTTSEPSLAEVQRGYITAALKHYSMLDYFLRRASPSYSISSWQEPLLNAIADIAGRVEDAIEHDKNAVKENPDEE